MNKTPTEIFFEKNRYLSTYPIPMKPLVSDRDISNGYITRYFIYDNITKDIFEVDLNQYNFFSNNSRFSSVSLRWVIRGKMDSVVKVLTSTNEKVTLRGVLDTNKSTVDYYSKTMPGIGNLLRNHAEYYYGD